MKKSDFINNLSKVIIDCSVVNRIQKVYGVKFPDAIQKVLSCCVEPIFFDDGCRMLSNEEIIDAEHDLHIDFKGRKMIPIADCGENDFIVYHFEDMVWSKYNIIDEIAFKKKVALEELLK